MLSIEVELNEKYIQNIRELAAYFDEEPYDFVNETMADLIGGAKTYLKDKEEYE